MIEKGLGINDFVQMIVRRRKLIIIFTIAVTALFIIKTIAGKRVYNATSTILIERQAPTVVSFRPVKQAGTEGWGLYYKDYYQTQYELIKSHMVLSRVSDELGFETDKKTGKKSRKYSIGKLKNMVKVKPLKMTLLIEISASDPSPEMAAKIANAITDEYIRQNSERNVFTATEAGKWLRGRVEEQIKRLMYSEEKLQEYRDEHDLGDILPQSGVGTWARDDFAEDIKTRYANMKASFEDISKRYTDKHPDIVEFKAQVDSLKGRIHGYEDSGKSKSVLKYRFLEREVQVNKRMYEVLLERLSEVELASTLVINNVTVITKAQIPERPSGVGLKTMIVLGLFLGLFGGVSIAVFLELVSRKPAE